jgi:hypothetical protein
VIAFTSKAEHGDIIGRYMDKPIYEFLRFDFGTYFYDGIAIRNKQGHIDFTTVKDGQCLIAPGLIYTPSKN